jgi:hypothetical protein
VSPGRTTEGEYGDIVATLVTKMTPKSAQQVGSLAIARQDHPT